MSYWWCASRGVRDRLARSVQEGEMVIPGTYEVPRGSNLGRRSRFPLRASPPPPRQSQPFQRGPAGICRSNRLVLDDPTNDLDKNALRNAANRETDLLMQSGTCPLNANWVRLRGDQIASGQIGHVACQLAKDGMDGCVSIR
jgi:hypothetical protein